LALLAVNFMALIFALGGIPDFANKSLEAVMEKWTRVHFILGQFYFCRDIFDLFLSL